MPDMASPAGRERPRRFSERLTWAAGPSPRIRPSWLFRGAPLEEVLRLRHLLAASVARRLRDGRRTPGASRGTRSVPHRPR